MARNTMTRSQAPSRAGPAPMVPNMVPDTRFFGTLQNEVDRVFQDFSRGFSLLTSSAGLADFIPRVDVDEKDDSIEVTAELPGLQPDDVEISLEDNLLTIRGEKQVEKQQDDKNKNYHLSERSYGVFLRVLQLPAGIDPKAKQDDSKKKIEVKPEA